MAERHEQEGDFAGPALYVLDLVAKTPVPEIRLFDADEFLIHTAFRAPGAASLDDLRDAPLKVEHFDKIYSRMHRGIVAHPVAITEANAHLLDGVTFAFISIDDGPSRRVVMDKLDAIGGLVRRCGQPRQPGAACCPHPS